MAIRTRKTAPGVEGGLRDQLLAVAVELFAEHGFEQVSVQDIVETAGVTKGAMYHYFRSKDDLLYEVYGRVLAMQMERLEAIAGESGTPLELVQRAAVDVSTTSIEHIEDTIIFWRSLHLLGQEQQDHVRAERRKYHELFKRMLQDAVDSGEMTLDTPLDVVIGYFFGAVHHVTTWYQPSGPLTPSQVAEHFGKMFVASLTS